MTKQYQNGTRNQILFNFFEKKKRLHAIVSLTEVVRRILRIEGTKNNGKPENKATKTRVRKWDRKT